jgi:hypothetical protein
MGNKINASFGFVEMDQDDNHFITIGGHGTSKSVGIQTYNSNGTFASPSASQTGDNILYMGGRGYGSTGYSSNSKVVFLGKAQQTWTDANQGTYATIEVTPNNSTSRAEAFRVSSSGISLDGGTTNISSSNINMLASLDTDLTSVSASDDTIPSAKATKTALDLKAPLASPSFTGTVTLPTGLTGILRADSGVVSTDSDVTDLVTASSDTVAGKVELATIAETNTGTDTGRAITPDGLAGSNFGRKTFQLTCFDYTTNVATGDGKGYLHIPPELNGMNLVYVHARVITAGTTGTSDIQIHNVTDAQDMLSTKLTVDSAETGSDTAASSAVINTSFDDVATNDLLRIDVDAVSTTAPKGLIVSLGFQLP